MSTDTHKSKHTVSDNVHQHLGDMDSEAFQRYGQRVLEWVTKYLQNPAQSPVLPRGAPGFFCSPRCNVRSWRAAGDN